MARPEGFEPLPPSITAPESPTVKVEGTFHWPWGGLVATINILRLPPIDQLFP
jgi:hypothetical protein